MSTEKSSANNGIGCGTVLFFILLALKLTHYIDWSWWWITAPIWLPLTLCLCLFAFIAWAGGDR